MTNVTVIDHPLLRLDLTVLRDRRTTHGLFRQRMADAASILAYEALRTLEVRSIEVETPLEKAEGVERAEEVFLVPILRAGLGLVEGFLRFVPDARVGHLGLQRDEETHQAVRYYSNVPAGIDRARVFVLDPMLATGGSASRAITELKSRGARRFQFVCLVAAPEGVQALRDAHPDVSILTAALDRGLDDNAFIRPGLGDAGDRMFGTTG